MTPTPSPTPQQPQIILLKEGTDTSQGKAQLISNIGACVAVADVVRTTLGPRGMDKLMHTERVSGWIICGVGGCLCGCVGEHWPPPTSTPSPPTHNRAE